MKDHIVARTDELGAARLAALDRLCAAAFAEPWDGYWERIGPALHVLIPDGDEIVAHACLVGRTLRIGPVEMEAAYVEAVAVAPSRQGSGLGTEVMRRIGALIAADRALGALATGSNAFYARLGWETWPGTLHIREADGTLRRTALEEGAVMVLRTPQTPSAFVLAGQLTARARRATDW